MMFSVVDEVLRYVYTGRLTLDWDLALWMYSVGYTMGSSQLKMWSSQFLKTRYVIEMCAILAKY